MRKVLILIIVVFVSCSSGSDDKLEVEEVYRRVYISAPDWYSAEMYVSADESIPDSTLKSECLKTVSKLTNNLQFVELNIMQDDVKVKRVQLLEERGELLYRVWDAQAEAQRARDRINILIDKGQWKKPDHLVGVWDVFTVSFKYLYIENDSLKMQSCSYDGVKTVNKFPYVEKVTIDGREMLKHIWKSDLSGGDAAHYIINRYGDLEEYGLPEFFQHAWDKVPL